MKTFIVTVALSAFAGPSIAFAQTQAASTTSANNLPSPHKEFVQAASMSSSTEIDASTLGAKRSQDADVKSFTHHLEMDHTKLTIALKMAAPHGVAVPKDSSGVTVLSSLS